MKITAEELRKVVLYNPLTGVFTRDGVVVGKNSNGYLMFSLFGRSYLAHRLAWLYVTGAWPNHVDHISGVRSDNRWINLRNCTRSENYQNVSAKGHKDNKSGHVGVYFDSNMQMWRAQIGYKRNGKSLRSRLGYFSDKTDAIAAYAKAKAELHTFHPVNTW